MASCEESEFVPAVTLNNTTQYKVNVSFTGSATGTTDYAVWVVGANDVANIPEDRFDPAKGGEFTYGFKLWVARANEAPNPCGDTLPCSIDEGTVTFTKGTTSVITIDEVMGN
jgi:hypothetical protein